MGRNPRAPELIKREIDRRITLKKSRIGLLKKAMYLSINAGCEIELRMFCKEDGSMLEYASSDLARTISSEAPDVLQHVKFTNENL